MRGGLVLTCVPSGADPIGRLPGGVVAIAGERILAAGTHEEVAARVDLEPREVLDATGRVVAPGFVDSHTHLVFGGSRVREYAARMTRTAAEVAGLGIPTGILATVGMTRQSSADELLAERPRPPGRDVLERHDDRRGRKAATAWTRRRSCGCSKSRRSLGRIGPADVVSTFLGAHDFPSDIPHAAYVDTVVDEMIPEVVKRGLAEFCDVYVDDGYYTVDESRRILEAAAEAGLQLKVHTDAYSDIGGARLAAELGVVSADHLNYTSPEAARCLAEAGVAGVRHARARLGRRHTAAPSTPAC